MSPCNILNTIFVCQIMNVCIFTVCAEHSNAKDQAARHRLLIFFLFLHNIDFLFPVYKCYHFQQDKRAFLSTCNYLIDATITIFSFSPFLSVFFLVQQKSGWLNFVTSVVSHTTHSYILFLIPFKFLWISMKLLS